MDGFLDSAASAGQLVCHSRRKYPAAVWRATLNQAREFHSKIRIAPALDEP
jgi:hypothetical protein